jgi:DNA repair protein RAD16
MICCCIIRLALLDERQRVLFCCLLNPTVFTPSPQFATYVTAGTLLNNYAHVFDLLIRLRQAVDHPYLVVYSNTSPAGVRWLA